MRKDIIAICILIIALSSCQELLKAKPASLLYSNQEYKASKPEGRGNLRTIFFSGYDWLVKSESFPVGPGPNLFSDSSDNVWIDGIGRLHLRITKWNGKWLCAEVISEMSFGYGTYRFHLDSPVGNLDPNIVLGLFTWSDDPAYSHREVDIEITKWGNANDTYNAQFVVQPFSINGLTRFTIPSDCLSTQSFTWSKGSVVFYSLLGPYTKQYSPISLVKRWEFTHNIPQAGGENVRINLWLLDGIPPTDGKESEVIVREFDFEPSS